MLPSISFETGRKTQTQSSEQLQKAASANGSLVLFRIGTTAEKPAHAAKNQKELHPRSSVACRESFCPLDKDLSWKSRNQTMRPGTDFKFPVTGVIPGPVVFAVSNGA
jgi:hypothetical protein